MGSQVKLSRQSLLSHVFPSWWRCVEGCEGVEGYGMVEGCEGVERY